MKTKRLMVAAALFGSVAIGTSANAAEVVSVYNSVGGDASSYYVPFLTANGFTANPISSAFTAADLAGSKLVILSGLSGISTSQATALAAYVQSGGRLLLASDAYGYSPSIVSTFNTITSALGSSITDGNSSLDGGYQVTSAIASDPFTAGVSNISYAYSDALTGGTTLVTGLSGQNLISYQAVGSGLLFGSADTNIQVNLSNPSYGNGRLLLNFIDGGSRAPLPEPATWAMMLLGFGGIGFSMRRRRTAALATA